MFIKFIWISIIITYSEVGNDKDSHVLNTMNMDSYNKNESIGIMNNTFPPKESTDNKEKDIKETGKFFTIDQNTIKETGKFFPIDHKNNNLINHNINTRKYNTIDIPTEDSLMMKQSIVKRKANEVKNDQEDIKRLYESNHKEKSKMEMTFSKAGISFPISKPKVSEEVQIEQAENRKKISKGVVKGIPTNIQKALEYYDIVYSK